MSKRYEKTSMGGSKDAFQATHWPEIRKAKTLDQVRQKIAVGNLIRKYWKPVYCYLRQKGFDNELAKDLTQGFFHEIVLERKLIQQADESKGRFRTFLLTALDRYTTSMHRKETAKKRAPSDAMIQLDAMDVPDFPEARSDVRPEHVFDYAWAANIVDEVLAKVKDEYCKTSREAHWNVFSAKVLSPIFDTADSPSLTTICAKHGVDNETKASNMIVTVKRRFRSVLKSHLRQFVQSDSEVEEEFNHLVNILSRYTAG